MFSDALAWTLGEPEIPGAPSFRKLARDLGAIDATPRN
jgi:hypothetical protein